MWRPAALVLAVIFVYANGVSGPFILDDELTVVQNQQFLTSPVSERSCRLNVNCRLPAGPS